MFDKKVPKKTCLSAVFALVVVFEQFGRRPEQIFRLFVAKVFVFQLLGIIKPGKTVICNFARETTVNYRGVEIMYYYYTLSFITFNQRFYSRGRRRENTFANANKIVKRHPLSLVAKLSSFGKKRVMPFIIKIIC